MSAENGESLDLTDESGDGSFHVTFLVEPAGVFGLPQADMTVVPGGTEVIGPTVVRDTGQFVGHGTMSRYRGGEDAIQTEFSFGSRAVSLRDNYLTVTLPDSAGSSGAAYEAAQAIADEYLLHLSLSLGRNLRATGVVVTDPDGKMTATPRFVTLLNVTAYNLAKLSAGVEDAGRFGDLRDERLRRALEYFDLALLLFENRSRLAPVLTRQHRELVATAFLNLWKAMTAVVGDPSSDRDHQSRYRALGFDFAFYRDRIKVVTALRDKYDVAHYSLDASAIEKVEAEFGDAKETAAQVLRRYREKLLT